MASLDYSKLRSQTIDSGQEEEAVTVNTRALIDKVLARYSGEWTTLRELIQNAADANASKVAIKFETIPSASVPLPSTQDESSLIKHTVLNHQLQRLVVTNNGTPFNENDWARLKRIAEGNPDETKIGAFGVGFYSVFSECENPLVCSGRESMAFFWKGNSLFTRRGKLPDAMATGDTSFVLDYRNTTSPIPNLMSICQFLSSSLTFVGLESIELWLDKWNVFTLKKKAAPPSPMVIPKHIDTKTGEGYMKVTGVASQNAQIDASWINIVGWTPVRQASTTEADPKTQAPTSLRSFFSRLTSSAQGNTAAKKAAKEEEAAQLAIAEDISGKSSATVFIRISTVSVQTSISSGFAAELERATKKQPPKATKIAILTSSHDETQATMSTLSGTASQKVAQVILSALPTKNGRVYIGFPTAQTTGILAHISAPSLIPTVERENIDLNARYVRTWNEELLRAAGIACRIAYAGEMQTIRDRLAASAKSNNGRISDEHVDQVMPAAIHVLKQFTVRDSTPLLKVGTIVEEAFWTCNHRRNTIELLSSIGVLPSDEVRIATEKLSFVRGLAVVPDRVMAEARDFMHKLIDYGLISETKISDIKKELEKQALSEEQLQEFLTWAAPKAKSKDLDLAAIQSLFAVTIVNLKEENLKSNQSSILELRSIKNYINSVRMSPDLPAPSSAVPFRFTKAFSGPDLQNFGWEELQIVPWLRWLVESSINKSLAAEMRITVSPDFSSQVLLTVSKAWDQLSQSSKGTVIELLIGQTVIPTKQGMRVPPDAYFSSVQLFDDLPTIQKLSGVKEKFLKAIGVRKTIELAVIFDRLMRSDTTKDGKGASWSHVDLIRYLVSVWNDLPEADINQLRSIAMCPAEVAGDSRQGTMQRYRVNELFEPKDSLRALKLSVLQWPSQWNAYSSEGKFLRVLGLRGYPTVPELLDIISKAHSEMDVATYEAGLRYFLENHYQHGYGNFDLTKTQLAFLPVASSEKRSVAHPSELFGNPEASVLGFKILREDLQPHASKLGVRENPDMHECAIRLIRNPPKDKANAITLFQYFSKRVADITTNIGDRLGTAAIVPITYRNAESKKETVRYTTPKACFLGEDEEYGDIFDYVDFGKQANIFLMRVGSKEEPTTAELTRLLIREPARIFQTLNVEKYLGLLRKLHVNMATLKRDRELWKEMKRQPFLLAYRETPVEKKSDKAPQSLLDADLDDLENEPMTREWFMRTADQIAVIDDLISYTLFKQHLVAAPQDETLEDLYLSLGAKYVSERVEEEPKLGPRISEQRRATQLRTLLLERSQLFLHEQPSSSVNHDVKWLDKNLEVQTVQSVSLRRKLKDGYQTHIEKRTAAIAPSATSRGRYILSITGDYEAWQVSQEVVALLIQRPKTQSTMIFEMFLTTSLYKLRARGYNVDRVLKRKQQEEARVAELEKQRRKEEDRKRQADEAESKKTNGTLVVPGSTPAPEPESIDDDARSLVGGKAPMPGAFEDSPEPDQRRHSRGKDFFSSITRHLGLGQHANESALDSMRQFLGNNMATANRAAGANPPPAYSPYDSSALQQDRARTGTGEAVTSQGSVHENLKRAVGASRAHGSNSLFNRPSTLDVKETTSYCDSRPGHDLKQVGTTSDGVRVFVDSSAAGSSDFAARNASTIALFGSVVLDAARVFGMDARAVHVFYNETGSSIAFNSAGSVFANFRFFQQLHLGGLLDADPRAQAQARVQALVYWWVVFCHELAHNLVQDHSSDHSYYTEQFVVQYFPVVMGRVVASMQGGDGAVLGSVGRAQLTGLEHAFT